MCLGITLALQEESVSPGSVTYQPCKAVRLTTDQPMFPNYPLSSNTDHNRSHEIVRSIPKPASTKLPARAGPAGWGTTLRAGLACLHLAPHA